MKSYEEELIRIIKENGSVYLNQEDVCRILEKFSKVCHTLDAKRILDELKKIVLDSVEKYP